MFSLKLNPLHFNDLRHSQKHLNQHVSFNKSFAKIKNRQTKLTSLRKNEAIERGRSKEQQVFQGFSGF
jgi:hypothetical protein